MPSSVTIDLEDLHGYLAKPDQNSGTGLLLVHAWWGLNEFFRFLADRFAEEGFIAFAPDYYNGKVATTINDAESFRDKMDKRETETTLKRALNYLKQHPSVTGERVGVVGISLGTRFSVNLARKKPKDIGAIILFYGAAGGKFNDFSIPLQGHFAENDEFERTKTVKNFEKRLAEGSGEYEFYTYPGTTHWFFENNVTDAYQKTAADLAFERTIAFLKSHL